MRRDARLTRWVNRSHEAVGRHSGLWVKDLVGDGWGHRSRDEDWPGDRTTHLCVCLGTAVTKHPDWVASTTEIYSLLVLETGSPRLRCPPEGERGGPSLSFWWFPGCGSITSTTPGVLSACVSCLCPNSPLDKDTSHTAFGPPHSTIVSF